MEFDGLTPFARDYPNYMIGLAVHQFDLHNDGDLREFSIDLQDKSVRLVWLLKQSAWQVPAEAETRQRKTIAGVSLIFSGVSCITMSGRILGDSGSSELDFLEYTPFERGLGETRIVFLNSAEASIVAARCQLRTIEVP